MKTQKRALKSWRLGLSLIWLAGCTIHTHGHTRYPDDEDESADVAKQKKKKKKKQDDDSAQASSSGGDEPASTPAATTPATPTTPATTPATPAAEPSAVTPVTPVTPVAVPSGEDKAAAAKREEEQKRAEQEKKDAERAEAERKRQERIDETARKKAERDAAKKARAEKIAAAAAQAGDPKVRPTASLAGETKPAGAAERTEELGAKDSNKPRVVEAVRVDKATRKPRTVLGAPRAAEDAPKARGATLSPTAADKVGRIAKSQSERAPGSTTADKVKPNTEAERVEELK